MPMIFETVLQCDVITKEERAVVLWKMAQSIYDVHWRNAKVTVAFNSLPAQEKELWIQCARAAIRAFMGFDGPEPFPPIDGLER